MDGEQIIRADVALVKRGLAASRERAQALIDAGLVRCNGNPLTKCAAKVAESDALTVLGESIPYVSRGGLKLEKALAAFGCVPRGAVCMDVGASTGGFTDVLLQNGARRVYAIDVGTGQLDARIAADPRVISMEHTNARALTADQFPDVPTLAVMDVSFISIRLILPALAAVMGKSGRLISLIKPQFEAGPSNLGKKGIVTSAKVHLDVLKQIVADAPQSGWQVRRLTFSPITGTAGNLEFLGDFVPLGSEPATPHPDAELRALVEQAHKMLKH